jgi:hypothetical protein
VIGVTKLSEEKLFAKWERNISTLTSVLTATSLPAVASANHQIRPHHREPNDTFNYQTTEINFGFISAANIYMIQVNGAVVEWNLRPSWEAMPIRLS